MRRLRAKIWPRCKAYGQWLWGAQWLDSQAGRLAWRRNCAPIRSTKLHFFCFSGMLSSAAAFRVASLALRPSMPLCRSSHQAPAARSPLARRNGAALHPAISPSHGLHQRHTAKAAVSIFSFRRPFISTLP